MKKLTTVIIVIFISIFASMNVNAQAAFQEWMETYQGADSNLNGIGTDIDATGNVYVAGTIRDTLNNLHIIALKYNPLGMLLWETTLPTASITGNPLHPGVNLLKEMTVDAHNNIYITGEGVDANSYTVLTVKINSAGIVKWIDTAFNGQLTVSAGISVDPNGNVYIDAGTGNSGNMFTTIKYDSNGNQKWVADNYAGVPTSLATDTAGNVFVTGATGLNDNVLITIKYNTNGVQQWVADKSGYGVANSIALDKADDVIITGGDGLTADSDYVTIKYNGTNGKQKWAETFSGPGGSGNAAIAIDIDHNNDVTITGGSMGATATNFTTIQYDENGTLRWAQQYNYPDNSGISGVALAHNVKNNVYVTGNSGSLVVVTFKYNKLGALQWQQNFTGNGRAIANAISLAVTSDSNVYITGLTNGTVRGEAIATVKYVQIANINNPFNYIGQLHDELLNYYITNAPSNVSNVDSVISSLVTQFICNSELVDTSSVQFNCDSIIPIFTSLAFSNINTPESVIIDSLKLSKTDANKLTTLINKLEDYSDSGSITPLLDTVNTWINQVLKMSTISVHDRNILLFEGTIAQYSAAYWYYQYQLGNNSPWVQGGGHHAQPHNLFHILKALLTDVLVGGTGLVVTGLSGVGIPASLAVAGAASVYVGNHK